MASLMYTVVVYFILHVISPCKGSLDHALHHYETLHMDDIRHHVVKRDVDNTAKDVKQLSFSVLGKDFKLHLYQHSSIMSRNFKAYIVKGNGDRTEHTVDKDLLYHGHLADESNTHVKAMIEKDSLTATIRTNEDIYVIEPSWRHITEEHNYTMIAYRNSDVKFNLTEDGKGNFCGHSHHLPEELQEEYERYREPWTFMPNVNYTGSKHHRARRAASKDTCPLLLIADYKFYNSMGRDDVSSTVNYMIGLVDRVDAIYRATNWAQVYHGYGFEISEILVHTEATYVPPNSQHYNMEKSSPWDVSDLLTTFSVHDYSSVCLSHLFTYQDFSDGVLGLAYIATPRTYAVGGICSSPYYSSSGKLYLNTGLTTTINWGRRILTQEADLVTAHELGHNFGSEHDPDTNECSPDQSLGGKFIMYPAAVSGLDDNNKKFSHCSERFVGPVLKAKSNRCFTQRSPDKAFCGNYLVEDGEECDAGLVGLDSDDECCDRYCYFRPGKRCSDANSACCKNCDYAPADMPCRESDELNCLDEAKCPGGQAECPPSEPKADETDCIEDGKCFEGECRPFCEARDKVSCLCQDPTKVCMRCCADQGADPFTDCKEYTDEEDFPEPVTLPNGIPCGNGFCNQGICEKSTQDVVERFWDVIEDININSIAKFMEDNIVGTVIVLSLLIWIPCSCVVHYVDTRREKEAEEATQWLHPTNRELFRPQDKKNVLKYKPSSQGQVRPQEIEFETRM
ncbi:ADAM 17-like protease isoform X1 [Ptychodera flava]|uniref:ADAM 17-like protease isoform X1 n=1 Tax=Ptychodera flava TaxID=63121 RepID=UPI00396A7CCA